MTAELGWQQRSAATRRANTCRKVVTRSIEIIREFGELLPVGDIAVLTEVSDAAIYNNFGSRDGLYAAIGRALLEQFNQMLGLFFDRHTPRETLEYFVERLMQRDMLPLLMITDATAGIGPGRIAVLEELAKLLATILEFCVEEEGGNVQESELQEAAPYHIAAMSRYIIDSQESDDHVLALVLEMIRRPVGLSA